MPGYESGRATLLRTNSQQSLFAQEQNVTGRASMAVQLERINRSYYPWGVSFEVVFTDASGNPANPGTFEIDIQTADTDMDSHYVTITSLTGGLNNSYVGRIELLALYAKYVRAYLKTLTNNVYVSALATR